MVDPTARPLWDERILGEIDLSPLDPSPGSSSPRSSKASREARRNARDRARQRAMPPPPEQGTPDAGQRSESIRTTRWRFRFSGVPLVLQEEVISADRRDRIVSRVSIGTIHFDQTLTFHSEDDETGPRTRLGMKIVARNSIQIIGDVVPRLDVQKIVMEYVDSTLRQAQKFCEQDSQ